MMRRAVALSPRPGDAVLACGATLAGLAAGGWEVTLVTVTPSDEEAVAAQRLGLTAAVAVGLAPGVDAARVAAALGPALDAARPDRIFAPLDPGAANEALAWLAHPAPVVRFRDAAAGLRAPLPVRLPDERGIPIAPLLDRKLGACAAYRSRVPELVGDAAALAPALTAFHEAEGRRLGVDGPAEALVEPPPDPRRERARRAEAEREERAALARLRAQLQGG
jgi:LmbE family N-acetylglucosaminyl deacetylase